jgi:hypothetical protein
MFYDEALKIKIGPRRIPYIYFLILLPCFICCLFYSVHALRIDYADIPAWDAWRCVEDLDRLDRMDLSALWRQHNEHRVIGVELLYWLDFSLLGGHQFLVIGCEVVCQLAQLVLLWWLLQKMPEIPPAFRLAFAAACGIMMTTAIHVQAVVIPFLVQWYLTHLLAMLALLFLWRTAQNGRMAGLVTAIATTVVITYTTGNGMLLWPVLVAMAALLRMPGKRIGTIVAVAAVTVAVYFVGYSFVGGDKAFVVLSHPFYTIGFMAILLGAPASYIGNLFGGAIGLIGMALTTFALVMVIRRRMPVDLVFVVAAGFCVFIVASAAMAAYGRINPADPTFLKARAGRYAMIALAFWGSVTVLIAWLLMHAPRARQVAWHLATAALSTLLLVTVMGQQQASERAAAARQAWVAQSAIGLENGVEDHRALAEVYQNPILASVWSEVLRRRRLSIFSAGRQDWIGHRLSEIFRVGPAELCRGSVGSLVGVDNGYRVAGQALDSRASRPADGVVLINPDGIIVGLGATRKGGYPGLGPDTQAPPSDSDWVGYARYGNVSSLQAYAIVSARTACPLGTPVPLYAIPEAARIALWLPIDPPPQPLNAQVSVHPWWIEVTPTTGDPQLLFHVGPDLGQFRTVIVRARFEKRDRIDAFFGKQIDGRGVNGNVPVANQWLDVYLNLSQNQFWEREHGEHLRFDPVSSMGPGTTTKIAGIWGSTLAAPPDWFEVQFYPAGKAPIP